MLIRFINLPNWLLVIAFFGSNVSLAMETSMEGKKDQQESKLVARDLLPRELWNEILKRVPGNNAFLNQLSRTTQLLDTTYEQVTEAYLDAQDYHSTEDEIQSILEKHFKSVPKMGNLSQEKYQEKVASALEKWIKIFGFTSFKNLFMNQEFSDFEKGIEKHANKGLNLNPQDSLNILSFTEKETIQKELRSVIKLMQSCQNLIRFEKKYTPLKRNQQSMRILNAVVPVPFVEHSNGQVTINCSTYLLHGLVCGIITAGIIKFLRLPPNIKIIGLLSISPSIGLAGLMQLSKPKTERALRTYTENTPLLRLEDLIQQKLNELKDLERKLAIAIKNDNK
jgi:hypothetical protein